MLEEELHGIGEGVGAAKPLDGGDGRVVMLLGQ